MANPQFTISAVVVAAGASSRMGGKIRKPFLTLCGKPLLTWTLLSLAKLKEVRQIVLVTRPEDRRRALAATKRAKLPRRIELVCVDGGTRRQDSVLNGLKATSPELDVVLIHDAARPFPDADAMRRGCAAALEVGGAVLGYRMRDTIKREKTETGARAANSKAARGTLAILIETTVPRAGLWGMQTPQIFRRRLILDLFERFYKELPGHEVTDDTAVCELFGQPVALVECSPTNLKVTGPEDLRVATAYLKAGLV